MSQALKITFCIPRPWVLDPSFTIVEAAREQATGFSFPSGHTQNAVGMFGGIACVTKRAWLRGGCIAIAIAVAFSRMYLGVHTPADVAVAAVLALLFVAACRYALEESIRRPHYLLGMWVAMLLLCAAYLLYALFVRSSHAAEAMDNFDSAVKIGWCFVGAVTALLLSLLVDTAYTRYETEAVWWVQILKTVLGLGFVMLVRTALKAPLQNVFGPNSVGDGIRYFAMTAAGGVVWPMTFRWFSLLKKKGDLQRP